MRIIQSNFNRLQRDIEDLFTSSGSALGYIVNKSKPMIWDPVWTQNNKLADDRFNLGAAQTYDLEPYGVPVKGGTIINNVGDIGFLFVTDDQYSNWEHPLMASLVDHLRKKYGIPCYVHKNDILVHNKKFAGTAAGFINKKRVAAIFISMNNNTNELINGICSKRQKYEGSIGLETFGVDRKDLIQYIIKFTEAWEARKL